MVGCPNVRAQVARFMIICRRLRKSAIRRPCLISEREARACHLGRGWNWWTNIFVEPPDQPTNASPALTRSRVVGSAQRACYGAAGRHEGLSRWWRTEMGSDPHAQGL